MLLSKLCRYVWWPTSAIRQNVKNLLILDGTLIILNWKWSESKTQNYFLFHRTGNRFAKQNKTFLSRNENKNKSEIKADVKLRCSWPWTTIRNRKSKINMFMARNCRSLCRYASRLDERLLYSGSKLVDELNRKRAWTPC